MPQEAFLAVLNLDGRQEVSGGVRHLYVHLPFCASAAGTATSSPSSGGTASTQAYVDALLAELELERELLAPRLESVFLGGGTPTFTEPRELARLLARAAAGGGGDGRGEPGDGDAGARRAAAARRGVTRVSLGAQSFQPRLLEVLERRAQPGRRPARRSHVSA